MKFIGYFVSLFGEGMGCGMKKAKAKCPGFSALLTTRIIWIPKPRCYGNKQGCHGFVVGRRLLPWFRVYPRL